MWGFSWLELHLVTTGQCYSVDVPGSSGDQIWGVIGGGRKIFIPADSQLLSHRLAAASMTVEMFVGDWLIVKFRQGGQNIILCREGPCDHFELFLFEMSSILAHMIARLVFSTGTAIRRWGKRTSASGFLGCYKSMSCLPICSGTWKFLWQDSCASSVKSSVAL